MIELTRDELREAAKAGARAAFETRLETLFRRDEIAEVMTSGAKDAFSRELDLMFSGNHPWFEEIMVKGVQQATEAWLERNRGAVLSSIAARKT